jgi:hypothetical protein
MSKKSLNEANLAALGADRLAALLIEVSAGSAEIKRRLRLELSHNLGAAELARDVRKRLASIRRSKGFVGWRRRKALIRDLSTQADMITDKIAGDAPDEAFELLWQFIALAPSVHARVDDSRGDVAEVFRAALRGFEQIGPRAGLDPAPLAARIWEALRENDYGQFDGIVALLAPSLGEAGVEHLKALVRAHADASVAEGEEHAALQFLRELRGTGGSVAQRQKTRLIQATLQDIALIQGDTEAYIAQFDALDLARPNIAAQVAQLHLAAGRAQDGLDVLIGVEPDSAGDADWDVAYIACLLALGHLEDAQEHRWAVFAETLHVQTLRDYLKVLPDFDDIELEEAAKDHAAAFHDITAALRFFIEWPDLPRAAQLVEARAQALDAQSYPMITAAAEALRARYPLAATLLWRAMIEQALREGQSVRYAQAADHLMDCAAAEGDIADYGRFIAHGEFVEVLRLRHRHKAAFWKRIP